MKRKDFYLNDSLVRNISEINKLIEMEGCRQVKLVDTGTLSKLSKESGIMDIKAEYISKLWQLGFLNADIIYSSQQLNNIGLVELFCTAEGKYCYADERSLELGADGCLNSFSDLENLPSGLILLFHPFSCFVLYHINRTLRLNPSAIQDLLFDKGYEKLVSLHQNFIRKWTSNPETVELFKYWNNIASLCAIAETSAHTMINKRIMLSPFESYEQTLNKLNAVKKELTKLFLLIGEQAIEFYRQEICCDAEILDPNKDLHLIIRLMKASNRSQLRGHIAGSMLFIYMAECLRRNLENAMNKKYPEEDEIGFGVVNIETKKKLQGDSRILDGNRLIVNQFLRKFGLDYGIRVNVYVEGDTEYNALFHIFSDNSSVVIKNLKGQVVERGGRGVSFRDSLRDDINTKTFSLIFLDGDCEDNIRVVKRAASRDEICGMFFVSNPDLELESFSTSELSEIAYELGKSKGIDDIPLATIMESTIKARSASDFFSALERVDNRFNTLHKGRDWGIALVQYAVKNPLTEIFGDKGDRLINRVIEVIDQSCEFLYEPTYQDYKVDPNTGELVER